MYMIVVFLVLFSQIFCAPEDEVTSLPGLAQKTTFRQYSGYLNGGQNINLHYWFFESQGSPKEDPVFLWLTGGPGCSSMLAMFTENGPFRVGSDGKTVTLDPHSWNTLGNILFLESPVGVGYSYHNGTGRFDNNDDKTAQMNLLALEDFFKKFPQFSNNSFYITGESYGGIYVPTLTLELLKSKSKINLKGIAIGNGYLDVMKLEESVLSLTLAHGMIDQEVYKEITDQCCRCGTGTAVVCNYEDPACDKLVEKVSPAIFSTVPNHYNVLDDCPPAMFYAEKSPRLMTRFSKVFAATKCLSNAYIDYMNLAEVRKALHIHDGLPNWESCSGVNYTQIYKSMEKQFKAIIDDYKLHNIIIYNGDLDLACDFLGDERFVDSLGYKVKDKYKAWKLNGRIGGFVKRYEGITFTTVRGAGHMVPTDQPEAGLEIIRELIGKSKLI